MSLDFGKLEFSVSFNPTSAFPLDARSYFESLSAAQAAAASAKEAGSTESLYYYGQTIVVVEENVATFYVIQPDNTLSLVKGAVFVDKNIFEYDNTGNLILKGFNEADNNTILSKSENGIKWIIPVDAYSKIETDEKIASAIANANHLKRKIVGSVTEIEVYMAANDDADQYIFMVPASTEYTSDKYDEYLVDKYQLARRIVDGTVPVKVIDTSVGARGILSAMKGVSNLMSFKSPNYNPAGVRRGTRLDDQYLLIDATREGINSTEIYATSYFLNEAQAKTNMAMIDSFSTFDDARLTELLGSSYVQFTDTEKGYLDKILGFAFADDFFMDYYYALDNSADGKEQTEWRNPTTLDRNIFLHVHSVISTSPFANCCVFIANDDPAVSSVTVSPSSASVTKGQELKLSATVTASNFANKSVAWEVKQSNTSNVATINQYGELKVPSNYNTTGSGTAGVYTIDIDTILETGDVVKVNGISYTVDASSQDTIAKQITAMKSAFNNAAITDLFAISGTSTTTTLTEKSGGYGSTVPPVFEFIPHTGSSGECEIEETTAGVLPANTLIVQATSIYDKDKFGTSKITVS